MILTFSPVFDDDDITLAVEGDVLVIDGQRLDFSPLPEGGALPRDAIACPRIAGSVRREGGEIYVTVELPHGRNAPAERLYPAVMAVTSDGPVTLPAFGEA